MIFDETGRIAEKKIAEERRKLLNSYDVEVAFKDGFCALFSGYGDTPLKLHWLHSSYRYDDPELRIIHRCFETGAAALY